MFTVSSNYNLHQIYFQEETVARLNFIILQDINENRQAALQDGVPSASEYCLKIGRT